MVKPDIIGVEDPSFMMEDEQIAAEREWAAWRPESGAAGGVESREAPGEGADGGTPAMAPCDGGIPEDWPDGAEGIQMAAPAPRPEESGPVFSMTPDPNGDAAAIHGYDGRYHPGEICDIDEARSFEEEFDYVFPGFRHPSVGILAAQGGMGKSMLCGLMTASIALGWEDFTRRGVIYLSAEDDRQSMNIRVRDLIRAYKVGERDLARLKRNAIFWGCMGLDVDIVSDEPGGNLLQRKIRAMIREHPWEDRPGLLILDTLRLFSPEIENDNDIQAKVMKTFFRLCRETGMSILVCHHISKNAALNGMSGMQQSVRGGSALVDNSRFVAHLVGLSATEADEMGIAPEMADKVVRYTVSKVNFAERPRDVYFTRGPGGILMKGVAMAKDDGEKRRELEKRADDGYSGAGR